MFNKLFFHTIHFILLFGFLNCASAEQLYQKITPIQIHTKARGQGNISIRLDKMRHLIDDSQSAFYQGIISHRGTKFPVAADRRGNTFRVTFPGKATGSRKSRQRLYRLKQTSSGIKISSVPSSFIKGKTCATHGHSERDLFKTLSVAENLENVKVLTISTFSDNEWNNIHGSAANHEIASIINVAEALYEQQIGIRFKIVSQTTLQAQPISANAGTILSTFQKSGENTTLANAYHLFTGKDIEGTTVGIAYVGAVCFSPNYAFGVTQHYGLLTANIFAHELGHNLGASHDPSAPGSIMYPSISWGEAHFSPKSVSDISTFLSYFGFCLSNENLPPSLHGAKLTMNRKNRRVTIVLLSKNNTPIQNRLIRIQIGKTSTWLKFTNTLGQVRVSLPNKKKVRLTIKATVVEDETITIQKRFIS
jgi:hypothetical protein